MAKLITIGDLPEQSYRRKGYRFFFDLRKDDDREGHLRDVPHRRRELHKDLVGQTYVKNLVIYVI
jgi:hypothetical protein